ncbi:MAG: SDR family oxidoreductase [Geminicoccaceae bacterium]
MARCSPDRQRPQSAAAYIASKAAVYMLTKALACEWRARACALARAGAGLHRHRHDARHARPARALLRHLACHDADAALRRAQETAAAALFLASDAASYVTGSILSVDGGYTAW